ncbi:MAG: hypothetical protein HGA67_02285 [Candidatus Yonathbacteria bacterium]|nr:hypothetical protein [Candidatus Yonathbacteria bacterium]
MKTFREYLKTFFPLRVSFSGEGEGGNGMRVEEDAGGGNATVATSSDLGELLPDNLKDVRCPFYGLRFDALRNMFVVEMNAVKQDMCAIARLRDSNIPTCFSALKDRAPVWAACVHYLSRENASGIIEALSQGGVQVSVPSKLGSEGETLVSLEEWYAYCTK